VRATETRETIESEREREIERERERERERESGRRRWRHAFVPHMHLLWV
jgi:hypothetical protein